MSQTKDPLTMYRAFREAMVQWTAENRGRFVVPGIEYWPEGVDSRKEAHRHYGEQYADEVIECFENQLADQLASEMEDA